MKVFRFRETTNARPTVYAMLAPVVSFDELWTEAAVAAIRGIDVRVASISHPIGMKEAAGRTQDLPTSSAWGSWDDAEKPRRPDAAEVRDDFTALGPAVR
jgi:hypothetical protein